MNLCDVLKNIELEEKVLKLKKICNEGYCNVDTYDSFDESLFEELDFDINSLSKPMIEKETNKVCFVKVLNVDEVVNGCEVIRPYDGTEEEIDALFNKLSVKKNKKLFTIFSAVLCALAVIMIVLGLIIGFTSKYFSDFTYLCLVLGPCFTFLATSLISLQISLKK